MSMNKIPIVFFLVALLACAVLSLSCSGPAAPVHTMDNTLGYLQIYVLDAGNAPLSGAKVVSQTQPDGQLNVNGLTIQDGSVTFTGIKPGKYEFIISRFDYNARVAIVNLSAGQPIAVNVNLDKTSSP
jgi:hypothetical protein